VTGERQIGLYADCLTESNRSKKKDCCFKVFTKSLRFVEMMELTDAFSITAFEFETPLQLESIVLNR